MPNVVNPSQSPFVFALPATPDIFDVLGLASPSLGAPSSSAQTPAINTPSTPSNTPTSSTPRSAAQGSPTPDESALARLKAQRQELEEKAKINKVKISEANLARANFESELDRALQKKMKMLGIKNLAQMPLQDRAKVMRAARAEALDVVRRSFGGELPVPSRQGGPPIVGPSSPRSTTQGTQ